MTTCSSFIEPLDLKCLLVNTFAGGPELFYFLALMFIVAIGAFFRMSGFLVVSFIFIFTIFTGLTLGVNWILMLIWVVFGIISYSALARPWKN